MAADDKSWRATFKRWGRCLAWFWQQCLDLALVVWVVRVPLCAVIVGFLILDYTVQAQDLFTEFAGDWLRIAGFLLLLTVIWAGTTHYAARLLLDTDQRFRAYARARNSRFLASAERCAPRLLGVTPFIIVVIASERSISNLPDITDAGKISAITWTLRIFDVLVAAAAAGFFWYTVKRHDLMPKAVQLAEAKLDIVNRLLRPLGLGGDGRRNAHSARRIRPALGPVLLAAVFILSAAVIFIGANCTAELLPRALIVPVILGGWLPLLTFFSGLGRQLKAPLIVSAAAVIAVLSTYLGDNHSVRRIDAKTFLPKPVDTSTIALDQALILWMKENGCQGNPSSCPRPMIIVGAGGASRAGFFTASVIGEFLDQAKFHTSGGEALDAAKIRKRIFAISAVSGSAVGAAMTVAALARAGPETKVPCAKPNPGLWYGKEIGNWRDCLEALMAGDFLTPTMIGLTFHDTIRFGWWSDRAALLERSWELRFAKVIGITQDDERLADCPGDLRCPFMAVRPRENRWLPLLLLNGTSATTGRRLLTTVLDVDYAAPRGCPTQAAQNVVRDLRANSPIKQTYVTGNRNCPIFLDTIPFHKLLAKPTKLDFWTKLQRLFLWEYVREQFPFNRDKQNLDELRLSTAAHNSARFPIISPPGAVRNVEHDIVDRIVDGGYIENYGALTGVELAVAIHAVQPALAPFVLVISNDPDENPDLNRIDVPDNVFLTDASIPLEAVENTRNGRGRIAVLQLNDTLNSLIGSSCANTAHIRVWPQYVPTGNGDQKRSRPVSLSWWLSTPIQIHLHQQTESGKSDNKNGSEIKNAWDALEATSACAAARR